MGGTHGKLQECDTSDGSRKSHAVATYSPAPTCPQSGPARAHSIPMFPWPANLSKPFKKKIHANTMWRQCNATLPTQWPTEVGLGCKSGREHKCRDVCVPCTLSAFVKCHCGERSRNQQTFPTFSHNPWLPPPLPGCSLTSGLTYGKPY